MVIGRCNRRRSIISQGLSCHNMKYVAGDGTGLARKSNVCFGSRRCGKQKEIIEDLGARVWPVRRKE